MENALSISRNPTQANPIKRNNILQNPIRLHTLQSPTFMEENAMTGIRRDVNQGGTVWNETLIWYSKAVGHLYSLPITDRTSWRYLAAIHGINKGGWISAGVLSAKDPLPRSEERRVGKEGRSR